MKMTLHTPDRFDRLPRAFTLVELLVSVAIIALLVAILLPSLAQGRRSAQSAVCLSNLHQMCVAAEGYVAINRGRYMPYQFKNPVSVTSYGWDLTVTTSTTLATQRTVLPGLLWQHRMMAQINQCPSYAGPDNYIGFEYTGYNYNTSFVGWCWYKPELSKGKPTGRLTAVENPARAEEIRQPGRCILFGDGEYADGANKYMRSPLAGRDAGQFSGRGAGTQGYRHLQKTNIGWVDGHAETWLPRFTETDNPDDQKYLTHHTGFISKDNALYDLQ